MSAEIAAGGVLLWVGHGEGMHLWLILTDPDPITKKVVMAMVVTERPHTDKTTVLQAGVHPFLHRTSNIDYGGARPVPISRLVSALESGAAKPQPRLTQDVLRQAQNGLLLSSRTANYLKELCEPLFADS